MFYDPSCKPGKFESWRAVLLIAADFMEQRGFCQDEEEDEAGRVCLNGAITLAYMAMPREQRPPPLLVAEALNRHLGPSGAYGFIDWNDQPGRTQEEAVAALRGAGGQ